jgi:hypothetical protein
MNCCGGTADDIESSPKPAIITVFDRALVQSKCRAPVLAQVRLGFYRPFTVFAQ